MANKMSVDRARFLAVAAALAGVASFQACTVNNNDNRSESGAGTSNMGGENSSGKASTPGGANDGGSSANPGGTTSTMGGATEGGMSQGGAAGSEQGGAAGAGTDPVCNDDVPLPNCEGVSDPCFNYCAAALSNLKPSAAVDAVACLEADATGNCDSGYSCLADATAKGCPEDVAAECEIATTSCSSPDATDPPCAQLLSGLNEAARAEAATCIEEGCFSVYSCAEGLFFQ